MMQVLEIAKCEFDENTLVTFLTNVVLLKNLEEFKFHWNLCEAEINLENLQKNLKESDKEFGKNLKKLNVCLKLLIYFILTYLLKKRQNSIILFLKISIFLALL